MTCMMYSTEAQKGHPLQSTISTISILFFHSGTSMGCFIAWPRLERAPLMLWMDEQRSEKERAHLIQAMVLL